MQRKKSGFDAPTDDTSKPENEDNSVGKIYSLPALYDLAFGYRNYDEEVDVAVQSLLSLIEPMLVVVLGSIVGGIVLALFMPLVKMIQSVSESN